MAEYSPFPFEQQAQLSGRSEFFTQTCLARLKSDTVPRHSIFLSFLREGSPKRKEANSVTHNDDSFEHADELVMFTMWAHMTAELMKRMRETQRAQVSVSKQPKEHAFQIEPSKIVDGG